MDNKISNLQLSADGKAISWQSSGKHVCVSYAIPVFVEPFYDNSGVIVVEPMSTAPDNAVVLNPDGNVAIRIKNPISDHKLNTRGDLHFSDVYYVDGVLQLVARFWYADFRCALDRNGNILDVSETR